MLTLHGPQRLIWLKPRVNCSLRLCRGIATTTAPPPPAPPPPPPPLRGYTRLSHRSLFAVGGPDASKFLNGIVTNKIVSPEDPSFDDTEATYAAFLNSKGRILADSFIYPIHSNEHLRAMLTPLLPQIKAHGKVIEDNEAEYLVECDTEMAKQLFTNLKLYKLRSQVSVAQVPADSVAQWAVWDDTAVSEVFPLDNARNLALYDPATHHQAGAFADVRSPGFGLRLVLPTPLTPPDVLASSFVNAGGMVEGGADMPELQLQETALSSYHIRRILFGIPEGAAELEPGRALPLESCIDYMQGINFNKGCYVGQELTIRSHHHGVVRKRVIPVVLYSPARTLSEQQGDEESEEGVDLAYDPESPISKVVDTSQCLIGGNIIDVKPAPEESEASRESPFPGSSPFGARRPRRARKSRSEGAEDGVDGLVASSRPVGTVIAAVGNIGLALVRLEQFGAADAKLAVSVLDPVTHSARYVRVRGFQPFWWPPERGSE